MINYLNPALNWWFHGSGSKGLHTEILEGVIIMLGELEMGESKLMFKYSYYQRNLK